MSIILALSQHRTSGDIMQGWQINCSHFPHDIGQILNIGKCASGDDWSANRRPQNVVVVTFWFCGLTGLQFYWISCPFSFETAAEIRWRYRRFLQKYGKHNIWYDRQYCKSVVVWFENHLM